MPQIFNVTPNENARYKRNELEKNFFKRNGTTALQINYTRSMKHKNIFE